MSLRHDIRACQKYADACALIAARAADAKTRDDFLRLQRSWLSLGRCLALLPPGLSNFNRQQSVAALPLKIYQAGEIVLAAGHTTGELLKPEIWVGTIVNVIN